MFLWDTKGNNKAKEESKASRRRLRHRDDEPACVSSLGKMMKLQNDATATELADVLLDLPGNDEDGYRLINVKHLASVSSEIHVCDEGID